MKYKNILIANGIFILCLALILILYLYTTNLKEDQTICKIDTNKIGTSKYYGTIENGTRMLSNNVWGMTEEEIDNKTVKSYIYYTFNNSFGWKWDRPNNHHEYIPPIYPEIVVGGKPDSKYSTTDSFPIKLEDVNSLYSEVKYEYINSPKGSYNLAYDIYFMDPTNLNHKNSNVMIWLEGSIDGDKPVSNISDGINTYEYHYRPPSGDQYWPWHGFVLKNRPKSSKIKVDIKKLLEQLPEGSLENDWVIPGIEFGNEIWKGSGMIQIDKFEIKLNNDTI